MASFLLLMYGMNELKRSGFVDTYIIFNLSPADRTLLQILAALDTRRIMFAWHIHAVLLLFTANHASIGMRFLAHQCHLYFADVGLVGSYFEDCFIVDFEEFAGFALHGEALPGAVGSAHVFDVVFGIHVADGGVDVAEVLVVWEVEEVVRFPPHRHLHRLGYFDDEWLRWSLNNAQSEHSSNDGCLELVGSHLNNHILSNWECTW